MEVVEIGVSKRFTDEEIINVYNEDYVKNHMGIPSLKKKYNYDFYDAFKKLNLEMRNNHEKSRKYTCNEDYFKDIDTEQKAYWLGFCYADGYLTRDSQYGSLKFGLSIGRVDYQHCVKFKEAIEFTGNINEYTVTQGYKIGTEYNRILITSEVFARNLMSHGLIERKSNIMNPPIGVPEELIKHFIRGFQDANGSIMIVRNKDNPDIPSYGISFCGTEPLLEWIQDYLVKEGAIPHKYKYKKRKEEHIVTAFNFGGNRQVKHYLGYIYDGATVWLDRKYDRYLSLCELIATVDMNNQRVNVCAYCGDTTSHEFDKWTHGGEYDGKILCNKHYTQLRKYGYIVPDKKTYCDICGGSHGGLKQLNPKWGREWHGKTLCQLHYNQFTYKGKITDARSWEEIHGVINDDLQ